MLKVEDAKMRAIGEAVDRDAHAVVYFNQPHQGRITKTIFLLTDDKAPKTTVT